MSEHDNPCEDPCPDCGKPCELEEGHAKFHAHLSNFSEERTKDGDHDWAFWHMWWRLNQVGGA